jgi:hypothetical protein
MILVRMAVGCLTPQSYLQHALCICCPGGSGRVKPCRMADFSILQAGEAV